MIDKEEMSVAQILPCLIISFLLLLSDGGSATGATIPRLLTTIPGLTTIAPAPATTKGTPATNARLLNKVRKAKLATEFLKAHNEARESLGMAALKWDSGLARFAALWAIKRRSDCKLTHSSGPYGENMLWYKRGRKWTATRAVGVWVNERHYYDGKTNTCATGKLCGHYTQIIWRRTTAVGCARVKCDDDAGHLVVCEYSPRGNYRGESPFDVVMPDESEKV